MPGYYSDKTDIKISNSLVDCRVFWARVVKGENESLFTRYTKHTFFEIQYALDGHIGMAINQESFIKIDEASFVIIPPDTYHQVVDAAEVGARFIMAFSIEFKDDTLRRAAGGFNTLTPHRETPYMRELLKLIAAKDHQKNSLSKKQVAALLESFVLEITDIICKNGSFSLSHVSESKNAIANEMQAFVKNASGIGIKVSDIARKFNVTERHVNRIFREATGKSPREFINREKLIKIEEYIVSTTLTLSEISILCGFCDEYAMNKFFKRYNMTNLSEFKNYARK